LFDYVAGSFYEVLDDMGGNAELAIGIEIVESSPASTSLDPEDLLDDIAQYENEEFDQ